MEHIIINTKAHIHTCNIRHTCRCNGITKNGKGFSLIEVVSACPTNWGMTPQKALEWVESDMLPYYPIGVYKDRSAAKEGQE